MNSSTEVESPSTLTKAEEQELREICAELEYRRKVNPLSFYEHLSMQGLFHNHLSKNKCLFGANRPLAYGTLVKMADGQLKKIEDIKIGDYVLSYVGSQSIPAKVLNIPFDDEIEAYKIITKTGLEIICSLDHCFPILYESNSKKHIKKFTVKDLMDNKYRDKRFISSGIQIYNCDINIPFSGLLLGLYLGDGSSSKSPSNGYHNCNFTNTKNEILSLWENEISKYYPLLKNKKYPSDKTRVYVKGELKNGNGFLNDLKKLGLAGLKSNNKFIPDCLKQSDLKTRQGIIQGLILTDGGVDRYKTTIYSTSLQLLKDTEEIIISLGGRCKIYKREAPDNINQNQTYKLQLSNEHIFIMGIDNLLHKTPKNRLTRKPRRDDLLIDKIIYLGVTKGRCITVDKTHTFVLANGIVTYNSGKTEEAAEYGVKRGLEKPKQRIWMCSETFSDSVNILQRKVWGIVPKNQIAYGMYDDINGFTNRKLKLKNGTIVFFKSYDQGVQAFAQDDVDLIINDEEPPYEIYKEQRMRLIDRNGEMVISMTSTKGVTDLIADIFEDADILETRRSPFLNIDLPIRAEKNGMQFFMLWSVDNPYIDQQRLREEVKLMTFEEIKARMHGIPINLAGKIYFKFNKNVHVMQFEDVPLSNLTMYHILDPHDRKPWAMQWWVVHSTGTCYCVDEYPNRNFNEMTYDDKSYKDYQRIIHLKEDALFDIFGVQVYKRIIDPNFGTKTIKLAERQDSKAHTTPKEELRKLGFNFKDGIDQLEAGHLKVREFIHWESKQNEIIVQPKIFFTDNCHNSITHMSRYSRKDILTTDGDVKDKAGVKEKYKDFCDLTRYFVMSNPRHIIAEELPIIDTPKVY